MKQRIPLHIANLNSQDHSSGLFKKTARITYHAAAIVCIGFVTLSLLSANNGSDRALAAFKKINPDANITNSIVRESLVEITAKNRTVYSTLDGKWFLYGQLFNGRTGEAITTSLMQPEQQALLPKQSNPEQRIPQNVLSSLSAYAIPGGSLGKSQLTILSDPDCSYCRQLNAELKQLSDQVETRTLLFPIEELHPGATEKSSNIWCYKDKDRGFALESAFKGELIEIADGCKASSVLTAIAEFADQNGFTGTPVLITEDGRVHQGYLNAQQIKQWMKL